MAASPRAGPQLGSLRRADALPGFNFLTPDGDHEGLDSDLCRVIAAAVLGDAGAVDFVDPGDLGPLHGAAVRRDRRAAAQHYFHRQPLRQRSRRLRPPTLSLHWATRGLSSVQVFAERPMPVNGICWHRGTPPKYSETQQIMTTAPSHLIDSGRAVLEQLGGIALDFAELDPAAPAIAENTLANRSGIDPTRDLVSIPGVWLHLQLRLHAAREHLVSSLYLTGLAPGRAVVNPATTLARSAVEASAVILWLCSNTITWEERLRRGSQLHLTSAFNCLKAMGIDPRNPPDPSTVDRDIMLSIAECNTLIDWVRARGWTCRRGKQQGKAPTISTWVREVPAYSDLDG